MIFGLSIQKVKYIYYFISFSDKLRILRKNEGKYVFGSAKRRNVCKKD